jgi:uncharacterized protein with FMN-binding domain
VALPKYTQKKSFVALFFDFIPILHILAELSLILSPMQKITLPLVMIASLTTLVSCGNPTTEISPLSSSLPPVTGVVETQIPSQTGSTSTQATVTPVSPVALVHDEVVSYDTPAGKDLIRLRVSVTDGLITSVVITPQAESDISRQFQESFAKDISAKSIGKKAKDLKLDAIGGASLTTTAFEQFVHSF